MADAPERWNVSAELEKFMKTLHDLEYVPPRLIKRMLSGILWEGAETSGSIALTFDDGPDPVVTPSVLDMLDSHNAKGTFFLLGEKIQQHPELARTISDRGHDIGSHGMTHEVFLLRRRKDVLRDITDSLRLIEDATGKKTNLFRPPHGLFDFTTVRVVKRLNLRMILWTLLSGDYRDEEPILVLDRVNRYIHPGAIIVFHDTMTGGGTDLPDIIDKVCVKASSSGLDLVSVQDIDFHSEMEGIT